MQDLIPWSEDDLIDDELRALTDQIKGQESIWYQEERNDRLQNHFIVEWLFSNDPSNRCFWSLVLQVIQDPDKGSDWDLIELSISDLREKESEKLSSLYGLTFTQIRDYGLHLEAMKCGLNKKNIALMGQYEQFQMKAFLENIQERNEIINVLLESSDEGSEDTLYLPTHLGNSSFSVGMSVFSELNYLVYGEPPSQLTLCGEFLWEPYQDYWVPMPRNMDLLTSWLLSYCRFFPPVCFLGDFFPQMHSVNWELIFTEENREQALKYSFDCHPEMLQRHLELLLTKTLEMQVKRRSHWNQWFWVRERVEGFYEDWTKEVQRYVQECYSLDPLQFKHLEIIKDFAEHCDVDFQEEVDAWVCDSVHLWLNQVISEEHIANWENIDQVVRRQGKTPEYHALQHLWLGASDSITFETCCQSLGCSNEQRDAWLGYQRVRYGQAWLDTVSAKSENYSKQTFPFLAEKPVLASHINPQCPNPLELRLCLSPQDFQKAGHYWVEQQHDQERARSLWKQSVFHKFESFTPLESFEITLELTEEVEDPLGFFKTVLFEKDYGHSLEWIKENKLNYYQDQWLDIVKLYLSSVLDKAFAKDFSLIWVPFFREFWKHIESVVMGESDLCSDIHRINQVSSFYLMKCQYQNGLVKEEDQELMDHLLKRGWISL